MTTISHELITSNKNRQIQSVKELLTKKSSRDENMQYVVEGVRLSEEAINSEILPFQLFYSETLSMRGLELVEKADIKGVRVFQVSANVMNSLSETETNQGILLVMPISTPMLPQNLDLVLIVDQLRDPGNLGTILRSATAAGVQALFLTTGSVDVFSPKVVRSGMGAHFHLPIQTGVWLDIQNICLQQKPPLKIVLAESENAIPYWKADFTQPMAIVIGGEADGPSDAVRSAANELVKVPMPGCSESLNAAVAASILMFEVVRQRNP